MCRIASKLIGVALERQNYFARHTASNLTASRQSAGYIGAMDNPIVDRLREGETVLWVGQPNKEQFIRDEALKMVWMFAIIAAVFLAVTLATKLWVLLCFAVPCALYAMSVSSFSGEMSFGWTDRYYVVTNKRIVQTFEGEGRLTLQSLDFGKLCQVDLQERADKTGTILCYSSGPLANNLRLTFVDNAREVYDLILSTQKSNVSTVWIGKPG